MSSTYAYFNLFGLPEVIMGFNKSIMGSKKLSYNNFLYQMPIWHLSDNKMQKHIEFSPMSIVKVYFTVLEEK